MKSLSFAVSAVVIVAALAVTPVAAGQRADLVLVSGDPLTDITATRAIERIWRGGIACDRHAFVASAAEAEQLDAFDAQLAKVVAAVRERWSN